VQVFRVGPRAGGGQGIALAIEALHWTCVSLAVMIGAVAARFGKIARKKLFPQASTGFPSLLRASWNGCPLMSLYARSHVCSCGGIHEIPFQ
jgi:hypothetical protein